MGELGGGADSGRGDGWSGEGVAVRGVNEEGEGGEGDEEGLLEEREEGEVVRWSVLVVGEEGEGEVEGVEGEGEEEGVEEGGKGFSLGRRIWCCSLCGLGERFPVRSEFCLSFSGDFVESLGLWRGGVWG